MVEKLHFLIFGHKMSVRMRDFLVNLFWSFSAGIIAMPISIVIGTIAGRLMGPAEYGNYNLVVIISSYIITFAYFGLDVSTIKRIVKAKSEAEKQASFFSSFVFVMAMLAIIIVVGLIAGPYITAKADLSHNLILFALIFTFFTLSKSILDTLVRALEKFKLQAMGRMIEILTLTLGFIFIILFFNEMNYQLYLLILILGMIAALLYYIKDLKKYFKNFSFNILKRQLSEGKFFMLSAILGTIFISSDRLLIAEYMGITNLGIYSAYYAASLGLIASFSLILVNVLLPATAKSRDKSFTKKIDKLFIKGFVPIYLLICATILVFLNIFGKAYPLKLSYVLLFAFVSALYFFNIIYSIVILDTDRKKYVQYFYLSTFVNLLTVVYYIIIMQSSLKSINLVLVGFSINLIINLIIQQVFVRIMRAKISI